MAKNIPHVRLTVGFSEMLAAARVIHSGYLSMGPKAEKLEKEMAKLSAKAEGAAVSSGTAALHAALYGLGVGPGDEVIIPAYSCQALLNAVMQAGAVARLADIHISTFNIDPESAKRAVTEKTKAIIAPNMFGLLADIPALQRIGVPVIEDCAMGLGGTLNGKPAGSYGEVAIFSFYATKTITGGEGGMVTSSNRVVVERVRDLRQYDKKKDFIVRYNYKMSDLNAAVALAQLKKLPKFIKKRQAIAARYTKALAGTKFVLPMAPAGFEHGYARYLVLAEDGDALRAHLKRSSITAGRGVVFGIHELMPGGGSFSATDQALRGAVSLPIYPSLIRRDQDRIIESLLSF